MPLARCGEVDDVGGLYDILENHFRDNGATDADIRAMNVGEQANEERFPTDDDDDSDAGDDDAPERPPPLDLVGRIKSGHKRKNEGAGADEVPVKKTKYIRALAQNKSLRAKGLTLQK